MDYKRALEQFNATHFAMRHQGYKESASEQSHEYLLPCRWCRSSRLRWNHPTKKGFRCWACGKQGNTLELVMEYEQLSYPAAMNYIEESYNGGDATLELKPILKPKGRLEELPAIPWPAGVDVLQPVEIHMPCWRYLLGRDVDAQMAYQWRLGFGRFGRVRDYVIFPVFHDGALVYWQGRATWDPPRTLDDVQRKEWIRNTHYIKSQNPIALEGNATAGDVLLNYDRARQEPHVVIVEGPFDAIKVGAHAVALLGKEITDAKIDKLLRMKAQRYTVYLDRGEKEYAQARKIANALSAYVPTFIAQPPAGYDPGKLTPAQNAQVITGARRFERVELTGVHL